MSDFYTLIIDGESFSVSNSSIKNTLLEQVRDLSVNSGRLSYNEITKTYYIDADIDSFRLVVSNMRGYYIDKDDLEPILRSKYVHDMKYFYDNLEINPNKDGEEDTEIIEIDTEGSDISSSVSEHITIDELVGGESGNIELNLPVTDDDDNDISNYFKKETDKFLKDDVPKKSNMETLINTIQDNLSENKSYDINEISNNPEVMNFIMGLNSTNNEESETLSLNLQSDNEDNSIQTRYIPID